VVAPIDPADADTAAPHVSTGALPDPAAVQAAVDAAYARYRAVADGRPSDVYPALARASTDRFGLSVASTSGRLFEAGDVDSPFTIMSVTKPFVFALICAVTGPERLRSWVGVNATGLPFNALAAVERSPDGRTNPMVNSGAIAVTSLTPGRSADGRWGFLRDGLSAFAGRTLPLDEEVYASASQTNHRNRELVGALRARGRIEGDPVEALDLYTRQCCLSVTARDLAIMGATLADGGVNPLSGDRVVDEATCRSTLAVMATAGLYETSGDWLYEVGLPGKSGIGGGIVTVSPGKGALGAFSPPLDEIGNSVRAQVATRYLSRRLGLDLFASAPWPG
jgi:glutaminase